MAEIPDRSGYAVELDTLTVHERYNDHAPEARRVRGLTAVLAGRDPQACPICFPAPAPAAKAKRAAGRKARLESAEPRVALPYEFVPATNVIDDAARPDHMTEDDVIADGSGFVIDEAAGSATDPQDPDDDRPAD